MIVMQTLINMVGFTRLTVLINVGVAMEILDTLGIGFVLLFVGHQPGVYSEQDDGCAGPRGILAGVFYGVIVFGIHLLWF